ncbi:hypothetical protein ACET3Z_028125 [Daucus carota]
MEISYDWFMLAAGDICIAKVKRVILKEGNLKEKITAPRSSGLANHSYRNVISSGASLQDSSAQNVVDEFFQPVKPTL